MIENIFKRVIIVKSKTVRDVSKLQATVLKAYILIARTLTINSSRYMHLFIELIFLLNRDKECSAIFIIDIFEFLDSD